MHRGSQHERYHIGLDMFKVCTEEVNCVKTSNTHVVAGLNMFDGAQAFVCWQGQSSVASTMCAKARWTRGR